MTTLVLVGGFAVLVVGGELLVRGATSLAKRLRVSPLAIGLTMVSFGTSTPELVTSIQASLVGSPGIAVGNVVGSNTANILLILGFAAVIRPVTVTPAAFRRDGTVLVLASLLCLWATLSGSIGRLVGAAFVACLFIYMIATYVLERRRPSASADLQTEAAESVHPVPGGAIVALASLFGGLILTIVGGKFVVDGALALARGLGVSEAIIGITIVAGGTSLPELVTSVTATRRGRSDVAFGNVVGSNLYNILGILGLTALLQPIVVPQEIAALDIWVMLFATAVLFAVALTGWRVTRLEGSLMLGAYGLYVTYLAISASRTSGTAVLTLVRISAQ
jgi:cation:H+ antiporter